MLGDRNETRTWEPKKAFAPPRKWPPTLPERSAAVSHVYASGSMRIGTPGYLFFPVFRARSWRTGFSAPATSPNLVRTQVSFSFVFAV